MLILAIGSRGDVQPAAVLAGALKRAGVGARVVGLKEYADVASELGADFVPVDASIADAIGSTRGHLGRLAAGSRPGQAVLLHSWSAAIAGAVSDAVLAALKPGESLLSGVLTRDVASALAGDRKVGTLVFSGLLPTRHAESHFLHNYFTRLDSYNRWGSALGWTMSSSVGLSFGREMRRRLGLPRLGVRRAAVEADRHPIVVAASPTLVPPASDWPANVHQTGFLAAPVPDFQPDDHLAHWLGSGAVYVGFGSMTGGADLDSLTMLSAAARIADRKVVTIAPPGVDPGAVSERVLAVGSVPHAWLFPRCAAVVHHGGSGTTHDGLRAGVPSMAVPHGVDQPYHGWRLQRLGVGPAPLPVRKLSAERLGALLRDFPEDEGFRARAAQVGERIRSEDGVALTVDHLIGLGFS